jgi:hypothetical protein
MPEGEHEKGREGVFRAKRLLEGTMRFEIPYTAYMDGRTSLPMLVDGEPKQYDLCGHCLDEEDNVGPTIYIESKDQQDAGSQKAQFATFLSQAYSATVRATQLQGSDLGHNFMWATTCPWKGNGFRDVAKKASILEALNAAGTKIIPEGHEIDSDVVDVLADRLWVWVISDRQEEMILSSMLQGYIAAKRREAS